MSSSRACLAAVLISSVALSAQTATIQQTAKDSTTKSHDGAARVLKSLASSGSPDRKLYIKNDAEMVQEQEVELGVPIPVFWLDLDEIPSVMSGTALDKVLKNQDVIYPLVTGDGTAKWAITMTRNKSDWRLGSIGRATFVSAAVPLRKEDAARSGVAPDVYFALEVPAARKIYLARPDKSKITIIPVTNDGALGLTRGERLDALDVLQKIASHQSGRRDNRLLYRK